MKEDEFDYFSFFLEVAILITAVVPPSRVILAIVDIWPMFL